MDEPIVTQEDSIMTYADHKLVESVKADPSPKNLGDMVTEVYRMNVGQLNSIECLSSGQKRMTDAHAALVKSVGEIKSQIQDEIHPVVNRLTTTESRAKFFFHSIMTIFGICGVSILSWVFLKAPNAAWVVSLDEPKLRMVAKEEASKGDAILKDEFANQTKSLYAKFDENSRKIESVRVEFRDILSSSLSPYQSFEVPHAVQQKQKPNTP